MAVTAGTLPHPIESPARFGIELVSVPQNLVEPSGDLVDDRGVEMFRSCASRAVRCRYPTRVIASRCSTLTSSPMRNRTTKSTSSSRVVRYPADAVALRDLGDGRGRHAVRTRDLGDVVAGRVVGEDASPPRRQSQSVGSAAGNAVLVPAVTTSRSARRRRWAKVVSEGGLEPPRDNLPLAPQASASAIPPLRRGLCCGPNWAGLHVTWVLLAHQQESERDHRDDPHQGEYERDAVEVAFGGRRSKGGTAATTEHVGQPATPTTVHQNARDHRHQRPNVDDEDDVENDVTHGRRVYRARRRSDPDGQ